MAQPFVGEIRCFGFNFAPLEWAFCDGQLVPVSQNNALFAILGTIYGGDGVNTFALPDLRGRIPMHWGQSSSGLNTQIGQPLGAPEVTLLTTEIPQHTHQISAATAGEADERSASPTTASYMSNIKGAFLYQQVPVTPNTPFSQRAVSTTGGSQSHQNMQPYLSLNFCIALFGIFPSRN